MAPQSPAKRLTSMKSMLLSSVTRFWFPRESSFYFAFICPAESACLCQSTSFISTENSSCQISLCNPD